MMKKLIKLHGTVMLVKEKVEKVRESGIVIPEVASKMGSMQYFEGEVLAIGDKVTRFKIGDWVIYGTHISSQVIRDGVSYQLMYEKEVECEEIVMDDDYKPKKNEFVTSGVSDGN